jgi:hypothetical protein
MNSVFHPYIRKFVVVYINGILIFSKTEAEHQAHVHLVLDVLNPEKFYVCKLQVQFCSEGDQVLGSYR